MITSTATDATQVSTPADGARTAAPAQPRKRASAAPVRHTPLRDIAIVLAAVTTGAAMGTALNVQSGVSAGLAGAIAFVSACVMLAIHALIRSSGSVAELDAEVQSLRKEVRRLSPAAQRRQRDVPPATADAAPPHQDAHVPPATHPWPMETTQTIAPAVARAEQAYESGVHEHETKYEPSGTDAEFERLQSLIRKLAEETAGPRASYEVAAAMGAAVLASDTQRTVNFETNSRRAEPGRNASETVQTNMIRPEPVRSERFAKAVAQPAAARDMIAAPQSAPAPDVVAASAPVYGYATDVWRGEPAVSAPDYRTYAGILAAMPEKPALTGLAAQIDKAIEAERVDVFLTPVQALADRKAAHYEISVKLKLEDDADLEHSALSFAARTAGLGGKLDALRLSRVARVARRVEKHGSGARVLSSFIGTSLAEDAFLEAIADQLGANPAASIVMSFTQADVRAFGPIHWDTIQTMSEMGLGFALDDVTDLDMDFSSLQRRGFRFAKLDASVFLEGLPAADGAVPSADICRHFSELGLSLIVGHIEDEWALAKILGFGVVYGQGVLFGAPRPVKAEILEASVH
jgi:EAL domain-containing protein (putative c-di-GMP-specific phosphodiesterase class I)